MPDPNLSSFIWSVADLLRGDYKQSEYGKVILPFTILLQMNAKRTAFIPSILRSEISNIKSSVQAPARILTMIGGLTK